MWVTKEVGSICSAMLTEGGAGGLGVPVPVSLSNGVVMVAVVGPVSEKLSGRDASRGVSTSFGMEERGSGASVVTSFFRLAGGRACCSSS